MKKLSINIIVLAFIAVAALQSVNAISLNPFKREGRTRANTLMISGNFLEPRLIVELAQHRTKQPIIVISPDASGNHTLFFMPAGTKPMTEPADKFAGILSLINPKRIIILGNSDYVPAQFVDIAQKKFPVIILNNADWNVNCQSLAELLEQPKLPSLYTEYLMRIMAAHEAAKNVD